MSAYNQNTYFFAHQALALIILIFWKSGGNIEYDIARAFDTNIVC